jgi:Lrp/AsnC family transcriptional regulator, regulator for asnA, asnC and gidA
MKTKETSVVSERIDAIDAKIIKDLLEDGRKSFSEIAKQCKVSSATISDHYKKLEETGIIVGATIMYNCSIFGFNGLATLQLNVESQYIDEVYERLQKMPNIHPKLQYNVEHNILVITAWKNLRDLDIIKETIRRHNPIIECKTYLWTDVRNTPENLSIGTSNYPNNIIKPEKKLVNKKNQIDETDKKIVQKLISNGLEPFRKIAQEIGVSTDTVSKRYRKLKEKNLIRATIQINPKALGYQAIVDFSLAFTTHDEINSVVEKLLKIPNISYIAKVEGDFDIHVAALARDLSEVFTLNEKITKIPNIKKLEAALRKTPSSWPTIGQQISTFDQSSAST